MNLNNLLSPRFYARIGKHLIAVSFVVALAGGIFFPVRLVVPAGGTVDGQSEYVSAPYAGTVRGVEARNGDFIPKGSPIAMLDTDPIREQMSMLGAQLETRIKALDEAQIIMRLIARESDAEVERSRAELAIVSGGADPGQIDQARLRWESARTALTESRNRLAAYEKLYRLDAVSQKEIDQLRLQVSRLETDGRIMKLDWQRAVEGLPDTMATPRRIAVQTAKDVHPMRDDQSHAKLALLAAQIRELDSQMDILKRRLAQSVITSPSSGILEMPSYLIPGYVTRQGEILFRVIQPDSIVINLRVGEAGMAAYAVGSKIDVKDIFERGYRSTVAFRGVAVMRSDTAFVPCVAVFDDSYELPIGSSVAAEAVHYRGILMGLVMTPRPGDAVLKLGW